jgi:hypothetical protein
MSHVGKEAKKDEPPKHLLTAQVEITRSKTLQAVWFDEQVQTESAVHPASYTIGTGIIPGGVDHPPVSSAEVIKEKKQRSLLSTYNISAWKS